MGMSVLKKSDCIELQYPQLFFAGGLIVLIVYLFLLGEQARLWVEGAAMLWLTSFSWRRGEKLIAVMIVLLALPVGKDLLFS